MEAGDRPSGSSARPVRRNIRLRVNGRDYSLFGETRRTLLDALRLDLGLRGTKKGCDEGTCGACTVLLDGRPVYSCLTLAIECTGSSIETIEGLEKEGRLHPIQQAFIESDALQCGFCTPGQVMAAKALLDLHPDPTAEEIRQGMAGNLCRCGAYPKIRQAIRTAAGRLRAGGVK